MQCEMRSTNSNSNRIKPLITAPCVVDTDVLTRFISANALDILYQLTETPIRVCPSVCDPEEVDYFFERSGVSPVQVQPSSDVVRLLKTTHGNPAYLNFSEEFWRFRSHLGKEWFSEELCLEDHYLIHETQKSETIEVIPRNGNYIPRQLASGSAESMVVAYRRGCHLLTASNAVITHARHLFPKLRIVPMERLISYVVQTGAITHQQRALFHYQYSATSLQSASFAYSQVRQAPR